MRAIDNTVRGWNASITWLREHSKIFDHFWAARQRYNEHQGGRLAGAIAYYGFFAVFSMALLAYSVLGFLLSSSSSLVKAVTEFLNTYLPQLDAADIQRGRGAIAIAGFVGLIFTGVGWVEAMRSSQRAVWNIDQQPGNLVIRRLVDLGMLVALGLLLALSLLISSGLRSLLLRAWLWLTPQRVTPRMQDIPDWGGTLIGLMVNFILAAALLSALPRLRVSPRRLIPPVILLGLGIFALTRLNGLIAARIDRNPALLAVSTVASLLLTLYLFNQLLIFSAAIAATSPHGRMIDLAAGPVPYEVAAGRAVAAGDPPEPGQRPGLDAAVLNILTPQPSDDPPPPVTKSRNRRRLLPARRRNQAQDPTSPKSPTSRPQ